MVDPTKAPASISDAVAFGTQLVTVLQTYLELSWAARSTLEPVTAGVSTTLSVLRQLQDAVDSNQARRGHPGTLKEEGLTEVNSLAQKCHLLFKIIIAVVQMSCGTDKRAQVKANLPGPSIREKAVDPALGPSALTVNLASNIDTAWVQPRIDDCLSQLDYLKMTVLLNLQIANLVNLYNRDIRLPGTFDQEVCFRTTAIRLRERQVKLAKSEVKRRKRACRTLTWVPFDTESVKSDAENSDKASDVDTRKADDGTSKPASPATGQNPPHPISTAPPYSAHTPVGHQGVEYTPMAAVTKPSASGSYEPKPLIPETSVTSPPPPSTDDGRATKSDNQASWSGGITAITAGPDSVSVTALFRPTLSQRLGSWLGGVFGSHRTSNKDRLSAGYSVGGSSVLEAYLVSGRNWPVKIPLGHGQVKHGLARTLRKTNKKGEQWPALLTSTVFQSGMVDRAVEFAKKTVSLHQRTCVAIHEFETEGRFPSYVLFFALAEPLPAVQFKDAVGRNFEFPYELCKEWKDMQELIKKAFRHVDALAPYVIQGCYDLVLDNGKVILPSLWSATITPGDHITMHMLPMNKPSRPNPPRVPPRNMFRPPITNQPQQKLGGAIPPRPRPPPPRLRPVWHKTEKQKAQEADYKDMRVVDFREEAKLDNGPAGVADMIRRFTYIVDAEFTAFDIPIESDDDLSSYSDSDLDGDEDEEAESESESESVRTADD